jgi:WD40 repeat protein
LKQVQTSAPTKGVFGVCVDPFFDYRLASYSSENTVMIWDRRNYERPIYTIGEVHSVATRSGLSSSSSSSSQSPGAAVCKLFWCPTRFVIELLPTN